MQFCLTELLWVLIADAGSGLVWSHFEKNNNKNIKEKQKKHKKKNLKLYLFYLHFGFNYFLYVFRQGTGLRQEAITFLELASS